MGRNAHECGHCFNETCVCLMCSEGACRSYGGTADKLCYKCDGTFAKTHVASAMKAEGLCSHCGKRSAHTLQKGSSPLDHLAFQGGGAREQYTCDACGKPTARCPVCDAAFRRVEEKKCTRCKVR